MATTTSQKPLNQLEDTLNEYFGKKAPALPENIKEVLVKIAPYLAILGVILSLPAVFFLLGLGSLGTVFAPFGGMRSMTMMSGLWLSTILLIPVIVLEVLAIPGLFSRTAQAWRYMFWAELISIVSSIVQYNVGGAIIGGVIGFYILFQVKSLYK